ncbi:MAG: hypothetical protein LIO94_06945 [Clostridiales bacterium]|nr:hypothetical protein [Clostridiales bacterium]
MSYEFDKMKKAQSPSGIADCLSEDCAVRTDQLAERHLYAVPESGSDICGVPISFPRHKEVCCVLPLPRDNIPFLFHAPVSPSQTMTDQLFS